MDIRNVVSEGFCVGCGGCASAADQSIRMRWTEMKTWEPELASASEAALAVADRVCPFSDASANETEIAETLYEGHSTKRAEELGYYESLYAGNIRDRDRVLGSSSGGLTSWFLLQLLERGEIDGVIHVGPGETNGVLFSYTVSESAEEIGGRRKSQYYSVQFSDVVTRIRGNGRRYAFVGVPCFVKAMRSLAQEDDVLKEQFVWHVGLVCGHMKSGAFALAMADQLGVAPETVETVDFRIKDPESRANAYSFGAREKGSGGWKTRMSRTLLGGNWGHALFQLKACDYCDDIFAETADICFGDAWVPRYETDWRGTNLVVARRPEANSIMQNAGEELKIEPLPFEDLLRSQSGNFRHRRDGLSVRLQDDVAEGRNVPQKRIEPGAIEVTSARREIVRLRREMAAQSHIKWREARHAGDMSIFYDDMSNFAQRMEVTYQKTERPSSLVRVKRRIGRTLRSLGLRK